jgi:arylsulfatase
MVENLDHNVGRLIGYLERAGRYDDTFVFFQSDNGAEGGPGFASTEATDNSYENLGRRYSNVAYGKRWGEVSAAPFKLWKTFSTQGGVIAPAIVRLPEQRFARAHFAGVTHVSDLAPTFLELAGVRDPGAEYQGRPVHPITGRSILPRLENRARTVHGPGSVHVDELFGRRYVLRDRWKLVWIEPPNGSGDWALYDLSRDRAESRDVTAEHPEVAAELRGEWDTYAARVGVVLPDVPGLPER